MVAQRFSAVHVGESHLVAVLGVGGAVHSQRRSCESTSAARRGAEGEGDWAHARPARYHYSHQQQENVR